MTVARELVRYKLDLMGLQGIRCDKRGTVRAGEHIFLWKRKLRRKWEDNIKIDLQEVQCGGMGWIDLSEDTGQVGHL
jgi:hypothetical protein